jgi:hypothetical protein
LLMTKYVTPLISKIKYISSLLAKKMNIKNDRKQAK